MACYIAFGLSVFGIFLFFLYPIMLWAAVWIKGKKRLQLQACTPRVSVLTIVRNGEALIEEKIRNALSLFYPQNKYEVVVYSDGSTDDTERIARSIKDQRLRVFSSNTHGGKIEAINRSIEFCTGDIVIFSDADALLKPDAVEKLVRHFTDPAIGGVCGRRRIGKADLGLSSAQKNYIEIDSAIKVMETRIGSITSNDGKLYAIRKELFVPIASGVADDLFICLNVIKQGKEFVFEPDATAFIRVPSRTEGHEIIRRRRIVSGSLRGIWLMRALLNPFEYGFFSAGLFINKVMRRLQPVFLSLFFLSSLCLSLNHLVFRYLFLLQCLLFLPVLLNRIPIRLMPAAEPFRRLTAAMCYFFMGNLGTLLGLFDFIAGKRAIKWEPDKGNQMDGN